MRVRVRVRVLETSVRKLCSYEIDADQLHSAAGKRAAFSSAAASDQQMAAQNHVSLIRRPAGGCVSRGVFRDRGLQDLGVPSEALP